MAKQTLLNVYLIMISFHLVHFHDDDHEFCLGKIYTDHSNKRHSFMANSIMLTGRRRLQKVSPLKGAILVFFKLILLLLQFAGRTSRFSRSYRIDLK